jgi:hypothetical protein
VYRYNSITLSDKKWYRVRISKEVAKTIVVDGNCRLCVGIKEWKSPIVLTIS